MSRIIIIPFFIPHMGCPFQCAFCNQWKITGIQTHSSEIVEKTVLEVLETVKHQPNKIEVAFFGGSFTGLPEEQQLLWLKQAHDLKKSGLITGIRLSTRPDYISEEILKRLLVYGVTTIELGVQSLVDDILKKSRRGHTSQHTYKATELIRMFPFELIYQLMLGLPGDNEETARYTAECSVRAKPDGVRVYPAVVLKETALAEAYTQGLYYPWTLDKAVEVGASWLGLFSCYRIPVIRMGLQATENLSTERDLLAGPYHPAFRELVESRLMLEQLMDGISKIDFVQSELTEMRINFNHRDFSKVVGHKKVNINKIQAEYPDLRLKLNPTTLLEKNDIMLETDNYSVRHTRQEFLEKYRINE